MPTFLSPRPLLLATGTLAVAALVGASAVPANADPTSLTAAVSAAVVTLPIGDGYRDAESLVVTASGATTATVTLQRDGAPWSTVGQDLALVAGTSSVAIPTAGLTAGTYTATIATEDGATASASFAVQALVAPVTKVTVRRSSSTVYPVKDGYRDAVVFTVTPSTVGPKTVRVTGTARLTGAGRTARTWKLHNGSNRLTWNGRVGSAVRPGRYTLTVKAKGPQGASKTARSSVTVSPKRLVTRTTTVSKQASSALTRFGGYDGGSQQCGYLGAYVLCRSGAAQNGAPYAVIVGGTVSVPKAVRSATVFGKPELRLAVRVTELTGSGTWGYGVGSAHATRTLGTGTTTGKPVRWSGNPSTATIYLGLDDDSSLTVGRLTFTYRYRVLV
jgi:hypothetical protein